MAAGDGSSEPGDDEKPQVDPGQTQTATSLDPEAAADEPDEEEDGEEEEEEEEPRLKYATLTRSLGPLYRNGDATSTFLVAGDKMASRLPYRRFLVKIVLIRLLLRSWELTMAILYVDLSCVRGCLLT